MEKNKIIAILGPTASGKTALAIEIALRVGGEVISGDSIQVYRGFDIGSAKPDMSEQRGVRHHLLNICDADNSYSVNHFQTAARYCIENIAASGNIPILCGGTGLYVKALLEGYHFDANAGNENRNKWNELLEKQGIVALQSELLNLRPDAGVYIDMNNPRRIIRALESLQANGTLPSRQRNGNPEYDALVLAVDWPRQLLYERINFRVDKMIEYGLVDEVRRLLAQGISGLSQPMQGIGYKEICEYLDGALSFEAAVEKIKINTRHFAKRQLTWFKKMPYIKWLPCCAEALNTAAFFETERFLRS